MQFILATIQVDICIHLHILKWSLKRHEREKDIIYSGQEIGLQMKRINEYTYIWGKYFVIGQTDEEYKCKDVKEDVSSVAKILEHQTAANWLFYPRQGTSK